MDFDDHEDTVDEMEEEIPVVQGNYENSGRVKMTTPAAGGGGGGEMGSSSSRKSIRYRECLKNHAVGHGGHAVDGCGEFMPAGEEGTLESLKCAACNCHRNFHRKEIEGESSFHNQNISPFSQYYSSPPSAAGYLHVAPTPFSHYHQQQRPLALPSASGGGRGNSEDMSNPSSSGGGGGYSGGGGSSKKRFRTKFTAEQKEKMHEFAERLEWRIQKHDEETVQQFCQELGIKRHVLKVWMHNNKHAVSKNP